VVVVSRHRGTIRLYLALHALDLEELFEAVVAVFATITRLLVVAEWCVRIERATVDLHLTSAHPTSNCSGLVFIGHPHAAGQAVVGGVGDTYRIVDVVVRDDAIYVIALRRYGSLGK